MPTLLSQTPAILNYFSIPLRVRNSGVLLYFDSSYVFISRVAVVGNVDAGKSTLLGVLTHGELDNGRGMARQRLFRHKHEMESGRTSSVGNDILGFDSLGNVVNKPDPHGKIHSLAISTHLVLQVCLR